MVPNGWTQQNLKDLCSKISVGLAVSVTPYMSTEGTRLIRNQNIKRDFFNNKSIVYIDDSFAQKNQSKKVKTGDIVAVRTGSNIGEACVVPEEFDGSLTFTTLIIRPHQKKLHPYFFSFHMNSQYGIAEVVRLSAGGAKSNLNSTELKTYQLLVPPIEEQQKIAKILSTWDKAITINENLIANSEMQKKALMQQLLTGKKRLLDENGVRFSGEWEKVPLSSKIIFSNLKSTKKDEYPIITSSRKGIFLQEDYFKKQVASENNIGYKVVPRDYITYRSMSDDGIFVFNKQTILDTAIISPAYGVFKFINLDASFGLYAMNSKHMMAKINTFSQGGTRIALKTSVLSNIKIHIPSLLEQKKIAKVISNADREIELLKAKLEHLKQEKKALMQQLLTGKRRVVIN